MEFFFGIENKNKEKNGVFCCTCHRSLTNLKSMVAGMGDICRERTRFAESLNSEDLKSMRAEPGPLGKVLGKFKNLIIDFRKDPENFKLVLILGINNGTIVYQDRTKFNELYKSGKSYSESMSESMAIMFNNECNEAAEISAPDHPMVRRKFYVYQKEERSRMKEREKSEEANKKYSLDYTFGNAEDIKDLSEDQLKNRNEMIQMQETKPEDFNSHWIKGEFHLATLISRLENANYDETIKSRHEVLKRNQLTVSVKDYGLTVNEVLTGLQSASKANERAIYKCFAEGNYNLKAIVEILNMIDIIDKEDKFVAFKSIQLLSSDEDARRYHEDPDRYDEVRQFIKKYNLETQSNWKK